MNLITNCRLLSCIQYTWNLNPCLNKQLPLFSSGVILGALYTIRKFWRISLYVTDEAIAKLFVM